MKITQTAQQNTEIGQKQQAAINASVNFLKGKIPEIVPMLSNPNTLKFLTKFLVIVASDPSALNGFKNHLQLISSAIKSDAAGTTATTNSTSTQHK